MSGVGPETSTFAVPDGTGVLLLFTGTPDSPNPECVASYLREFLMDPCVMDMPRLVRALLVKGIIVPLRARKSAAKYQRIWTDEGSPLAVHTRRFRSALRRVLPGCPMAEGAAYGSPGLAEALEALLAQGVTRLVVFPLFPQYARATRGSLRAMFEKALNGLARGALEVREVPPFYANGAYLDAMKALAAPMLRDFQADHVVFSYHGLPLRQAHAAPEDGSALNYEDQCLRGTELLAEALGLKPEQYTQAYQSRFGRGWLTPATDTVLTDLAKAGRKRVALIAPSFVADCLETLEELDLEARDAFLGAGGGAFLRVPSLNDHPAWVLGAAQLVRNALEDG